VHIEVLFQNETFWLSQKKMADLFRVEVPAISKHLNSIYETGELSKEATISILETVQQEGSRNVKRNVEFYNLDAIIAVGYRVNSIQATQFRIWATKTLREFIIIRASERRFYLKITDIYEQCSIDYNKEAGITQTFFKTVQNKLHFAISCIYCVFLP
jgi:hypothetical protein